MNLVISTTGFKEPSYVNIELNKDNIKDFKLPDSISNIIVHKVFHLLTQQEMIGVLDEIYLRLVPGGKITIHCIDTYELSHRMHRRHMSEADFNTLLYEDGQKNCFSTIFFIQHCVAVGLKKSTVSFNDIWAKMEFVK